MKTSIFFFSISFLWVICATNSTKGQSWHWAKGLGGSSPDFGESITVDPVSRAVYTTGYFSGTVDFDPGPGVYNITPTGYYDTFISKLDSAGNFLWVKAMGGSNYTFGSSIALDLAGSGAIYTTGWFQGTIDFDPGPGVYNLASPEFYNWAECPIPDCPYPGNCFEPCFIIGPTHTMFISKLDSSGNFQWAKAMEASADESGIEGYSIAVDPSGSGDVYTTGSFWGSIDLDPSAGTYLINGGGMFTSKSDSEGNFVWGKVINANAGDSDRSLALDTSGYVYIIGTAQNIHISKLDNSGLLIWEKEMGGPGGSSGYAIDVDLVSGDVYTTGNFNGTVDFNPGTGIFNLTSEGFSSLCISKLDSSGSFVWAKAIVGSEHVRGQSIAFDQISGNVHVSGFFGATADFNPGVEIFNLTSAGSQDIFISKLSSSGNFIWAGAIGGTGYDNCKSATLDPLSNLHVTGYYASSTITFGTTTLINEGWEDGFVAKLDGTACHGIVISAGDSGFGTLRDIISCASPAANITFSLPPMSQITLTTGEIVINKNLNLSGLGMLDLTLSGNNTSRIFHLLPGKNLEIENLALKNASALTNGGAIFAEGSLTLENVLLQNNFQNGVPKAMTISPGGLITINGNVEIKN